MKTLNPSNLWPSPGAKRANRAPARNGVNAAQIALENVASAGSGYPAPHANRAEANKPNPAKRARRKIVHKKAVKNLLARHASRVSPRPNSPRSLKNAKPSPPMARKRRAKMAAADAAAGIGATVASVARNKPNLRQFR